MALEVERILRCSSHYQVLRLEDALLAEAQRVRRRYKELAVLVHPDKNRSNGAEAAFKRLSEAYECLVDEVLQQEYLQKLHGQKSTRSTTNKRKRERNTPPSEVRPSKPKRQRTPEEIWQQFQREEEELARQEFRTKGFNRVYESNSSGRSSPPETVTEEEQKEILDSNLDGKARAWKSWSTAGTRPKAGEETTTQEGGDAGGGDATNTSSSNDSEAEVICCLLCRRKFSTIEALARHKAFSTLHLRNMQAQQHQSL